MADWASDCAGAAAWILGVTGDDPEDVVPVTAVGKAAKRSCQQSDDPANSAPS